MPEERRGPPPTAALATQLEQDFVSPLTAVRGALEILRDFPDLDAAKRERFVAAALEECARLERGVERLGRTVYAAGARTDGGASPAPDAPAGDAHAERIHFLQDHDAVEIDLSGLEFSSSAVVNDFHDALDRALRASGRRWYFLVNYRDCSIWPEAWVAFAHRGKEIHAAHSLGTVRYGEADGAARGRRERDLHPSRDAALAEIDARRRAARSD